MAAIRISQECSNVVLRLYGRANSQIARDVMATSGIYIRGGAIYQDSLTIELPDTREAYRLAAAVQALVRWCDVHCPLTPGERESLTRKGVVADGTGQT